MARRVVMQILGAAVALALAATGAATAAEPPPGLAPAAPSAPAEQVLVAALSGTGSARNEAADFIIAHPDAVNPIVLALVAESLWDRGDREQAAFWFYVFQSRTLAWMGDGEQSSADMLGILQSMTGQPVNYIAGRRALNSRIGRPINEWAFSDLGAMKALALRVFADEERMPLYPGRPEGVSEGDWAASVVEKRARYEAGFHEAFGETDAKDYARRRRQQGLYVGPWKDRGAPLPDAWR